MAAAAAGPGEAGELLTARSSPTLQQIGVSSYRGKVETFSVTPRCVVFSGS